MRSGRGARPRGSRGISLIEVLVTLVIIAIGLLGLAGLQVRLQDSEVEAYQRSQATLLLADIKGRIEANRKQVATYPTNAPVDDPVGAGGDCPTTDGSSTRAQVDVADWCNALQGAAEASGGSRVGAMLGGRGCVEDLGVGASGEQTFRVTVAWQGLTPTAAPAEACGAGLYNGGSKCLNDLCRRTVSTIVRIANLN